MFYWVDNSGLIESICFNRIASQLKFISKTYKESVLTHFCIGRIRARRRRGWRTQPKTQLPNWRALQRNCSWKIEIKISRVGAVSIGETESRDETSPERVGRWQELPNQGRASNTSEQIAPGWRWARPRGKVSTHFECMPKITKSWFIRVISSLINKSRSEYSKFLSGPNFLIKAKFLDLVTICQSCYDAPRRKSRTPIYRWRRSAAPPSSIKNR